MDNRSTYINFFKKNFRFILKKIDCLLIKQNRELKFAPIFIIGCPRSGSTLLCQIITRYFKVCYFSNLMARFPESPVAIAVLAAFMNDCNPSPSFKNQFGETDGWKSHNHGLKIFDRWIDPPDTAAYTSPMNLSKKNIKEMRNTIAFLELIFNAPFVNKSQTNSMRIFAISKILPEALFIRIKRNPIFSAQSALQYKRILNRWLFTKPRNYEIIEHKNDIEKACELIINIEKDIDSDINIVGKDKFLIVHYEDLCRSPKAVMNRINGFYMKNQKHFALKVRNKIPSFFPSSNNINIKMEEFNSIKKYIESKTL